MNRSAGLMMVLALGLVSGCASKRAGSGGDFAQSLVDHFTGNTPIRDVEQMEDRYSADQRREGINRLVSRSFGKRPPYTDRYAQIAQFDSDYLVRATAVRALNRSRDQSATPVLIKCLADANPLVRQEAAKALANLPDPRAIGPLTKLVANPDENRDVRIASADALRHYRQLDVARSLAATLPQRDFSVAWQARRSLVQMTGQDMRYDEAKWLEFLTGPDRPFG